MVFRQFQGHSRTFKRRYVIPEAFRGISGHFSESQEVLVYSKGRSRVITTRSLVAFQGISRGFAGDSKFFFGTLQGASGSFSRLHWCKRGSQGVYGLLTGFQEVSKDFKGVSSASGLIVKNITGCSQAF